MGGHGFGQSGLVQLNADWLSKPTVEGDNWMITQQVARFLVKKTRERVSSADATANSRTEVNIKSYCQNRMKRQHFPIIHDDFSIVEAFSWRSSWLVSANLNFDHQGPADFLARISRPTKPEKCKNGRGTAC
jgi:acyl-CoA oxidase